MRLPLCSRITVLNRADVRLTEMENNKMTDEISVRLSTLSKHLKAHPDDEDAYIERGRLYWSLGRRSDAINDYLAAQRLNPEGKATELLKATYAILDFYNKDLYNP